MRRKQKTDALRGDLRVYKTRRLLQDALVTLMAERSFESITIKEITDKALVNHATFYRHYRDKYGLAEAIFAEAIDSIPSAETRRVPPDRHRPWATLFRHVEKNDRLYKALLGPGGNAPFIRRIRDYIAMVARKGVETRIRLKQPVFGTGVAKAPESDLPFIFVANFFIANIAWWLEDGRQYSCDQILDWTRTFLDKGLGGLLRR